MVELDICPRCNKKPYRVTTGVCHNCYRKYIWKREKRECKECKQVKYIQAWDYCGPCYNHIFGYIENIRMYNYKKSHNIDLETYRKITRLCVICQFDKTVDLHHLDENHKNNSETNLVGLCPNHHKMAHTRRYKEEISNALKEKGFNILI